MNNHKQSAITCNRANGKTNKKSPNLSREGFMETTGNTRPNPWTQMKYQLQYQWQQNIYPPTEESLFTALSLMISFPLNKDENLESFCK